VFALIGPKKVDMPWKELERQAGLPQPAATKCVSQCLSVAYGLRRSVAARQVPHRRGKPLKKEMVRQILAYHPHAQTLIIGVYVEQLRELARSSRSRF